MLPSHNVDQLICGVQRLSVKTSFSSPLVPSPPALPCSAISPKTNSSALWTPLSYQRGHSLSTDHASMLLSESPSSPLALHHDALGSFSPTGAKTTIGGSLHQAFLHTRSRVLRLLHPHLPSSFLLSKLAASRAGSSMKRLGPVLWKAASFSPAGTLDNDSVWLVFDCHEKACTALSLLDSSFPLIPTLESDLERVQDIQRVAFWEETEEEMPGLVLPVESRPPITSVTLSAPQPYRGVHETHLSEMLQRPRPLAPESLSPFAKETFSMSSNPPNPKMTFRAGDWMCSVPTCAAHNFGRNVSCIRCAAPRSPSINQNAYPSIQTMIHQVSPRFINTSGQLEDGYSSQPFTSRQLSSPTSPTSAPSSHPFHCSVPQSPTSGSKVPAPTYPLLTPSGQALSAGGRVQNISSDPLCPCIMYWPDNEPLPDRGQIRPLGSAVIQFPPIVNTGNKGAAEKQPGDWVCQKCNYLNWRRRKVCQTCYPYAEGNGDSISAAVQAERIALLANVLTQTQTNPSSPVSEPQRKVSAQHQPTAAPHAALEQHQQSSLLPPPSYRAWPTIDPLPPSAIPRSSSMPQSDNLASQYQHSHPIYQTSGHTLPLLVSPPSTFSSRSSSSAVGYSLNSTSSTIDTSCNLLPSFLQDIIESPSISPATSSSSHSPDLSSFDRHDFESFDGSSSNRGGRYHPYGTNTSSSNSSATSIWRLDGEESKNLGFSATPTGQECVIDVVGKVTSNFSAFA